MLNKIKNNFDNVAICKKQINSCIRFLFLLCIFVILLNDASAVPSCSEYCSGLTVPEGYTPHTYYSDECREVTSSIESESSLENGYYLCYDRSISHHVQISKFLETDCRESNPYCQCIWTKNCADFSSLCDEATGQCEPVPISPNPPTCEEYCNSLGLSLSLPQRYWFYYSKCSEYGTSPGYYTCYSSTNSEYIHSSKFLETGCRNPAPYCMCMWMKECWQFGDLCNEDTGQCSTTPTIISMRQFKKYKVRQTLTILEDDNPDAEKLEDTKFMIDLYRANKGKTEIELSIDEQDTFSRIVTKLG